MDSYHVLAWWRQPKVESQTHTVRSRDSDGIGDEPVALKCFVPSLEFQRDGLIVAQGAAAPSASVRRGTLGNRPAINPKTPQGWS